MSALASRWWARGLLRVHRLLYKASGGRAGLYVYLLCAQPIETANSGTPVATAASTDTTRIARVDRGDAMLQAFKRPAAVIEQRFSDGARCYGATVKQGFAGHIWIATRHYDEDEVRCRYVLPANPASVWDFDVYVEPAYRLTRVLSRMWATVMQELSLQGVRWSFSRISLYSRRSVATHERLGARSVGYAAFLVLGPVQLSLHSDRPVFHACTGGSAAPSVRLRPPAD